MEDEHKPSIEELRLILRREKTTKALIRWLAAALIVVMSLFAVVAGYLIVEVNHNRTISDRQDCARHYSSLLSAKTNRTVFDGLEQNSQLGQALFGSVENGVRPTAEAVTNFGVISNMLTHDLDVVKGRNGNPKLPTPDQAVDRGMVLDGTRYPACPGG